MFWRILLRLWQVQYPYTNTTLATLYSFQWKMFWWGDNTRLPFPNILKHADMFCIWKMCWNCWMWLHTVLVDMVYIYIYTFLVHFYRTSMEMHHLLMLDIVLYQTCHEWWGIGCLIKGGTMHFEYISEVRLLWISIGWMETRWRSLYPQMIQFPTVDGWNPAVAPVEVGSWNPIIYRVLYIPGGCLGFLPSTVWFLKCCCLR